MGQKIRIGMIGLDTSHVPAFAELLNDPNHAYHVAGGIVAVGFPGGSDDFELSRSRVAGYTETLREKYGVAIVDSPEAVAEQCDAILLHSVDGRVHLEQFRKIAPYGKPVFIDKPFAVTSADAREMAALAKQYGVPLASSSSLRYMDAFIEAVHESNDDGPIVGFDLYGPMPIEPTQPGLFWYGIHTVDALFAGLGKGCESVVATTSDSHDVIVGRWKDGRVGTIRGNRTGNSQFGGVIHRERKSRFFDAYSRPKPGYASLLEQILPMFQTGIPPIDIEESIETIRFIEAANESRLTGRTVTL